MREFSARDTGLPRPRGHSSGRTRPSPWPEALPQMPGSGLRQSGQRPSRADAVVGDEEAVAVDDGRVAVVAAGVFPLADLAGEVAGVEVSAGRPAGRYSTICSRSSTVVRR